MIFFNELQSIIASNLTQNLADSLCIRFGYDYDVDFKDVDGEHTAQDIYDLVPLRRASYQFNRWKELADEIGARICALKDDEIGLSRFIRDEILTQLYFELWFLYGDNREAENTTFQTLVSILIVNNCSDSEPPKELFLLHEKEINKLGEKRTDMTGEELANYMMDNIVVTLKAFANRNEDPLFNKCRYINNIFRRLASIIEGNLLRYHCSHDLFSYQLSSGIILYPFLTAEDIIKELKIPNDTFFQISRGYTRFDNYTEFAGYGMVEPGDKIRGVSFSGISEIDALLWEAKSTKQPYYPRQHAHRNRWHFEQKCEEIMNAEMSQEQKEKIVFELVHILYHCYSIFKNNPEKKELLQYAMVYYGVLDNISMRAASPICLIKFCQELGAEDLLTDPFFDPVEELAKREGLSDPNMPWLEYTRQALLSKTLDFYESRLCRACDRISCPFRKSDSEIIPALTKTSTKTRNATIPQFVRAYEYVCEYLSNKKTPYVYQEKGSLHWRFNNSDQLFAYVGMELKRLFKVSQIPWEGIIEKVHADGSIKHLKELASKYKKEKSTKGAKDFPEGFRLVDEAIDKYQKTHKKRVRE